MRIRCGIKLMNSSTENPFQFGTKRPSKASIDVALPKPGGRQVWFLRGIARRILRLTSFDGCGVLRRKVFYGMRALLTGTLFRPAGVQVRDIKGLCKSVMTLAPPRTNPPHLRHPAAPPHPPFCAATSPVCVRPYRGCGLAGPDRRTGCSVHRGPNASRTTRPDRVRREAGRIPS